MTATCATCRFAQEHAYCIPTPTMAVIRGTELRCHIRSVPGDFPSRKPDDWCGEHTPKEAP